MSLRKTSKPTPLTKRRNVQTARTRNPARTRLVILQAAKELFSRSDFGSVSLSDVAEQAGVTQSLIHHYFKTKSRLFLCAIHSSMNDFDDGLDAWVSPGVGTPEIIHKAIEGYFRFLEENDLCVRLYRLFDHSLHIDPNLLGNLRELDKEGETGNRHRLDNLKAVYERIKDLQAGGMLNEGIDAKALVIAFLSLVEHWHSSSKRLNHRLEEALGLEEAGEGVTAEEYLKTVVQLFVKGALKT